MDISGKVAIVTGASSGIGAAVAEHLSRKGATVVATARRDRELQETARRCREHAPASFALRADVADPAQCEQVVASAAAGSAGSTS